MYERSDCIMNFNLDIPELTKISTGSNQNLLIHNKLSYNTREDTPRNRVDRLDFIIGGSKFTCVKHNVYKIKQLITLKKQRHYVHSLLFQKD